MKLAYKLFCITYIIVIISAGFGGFVLLQITVSSLQDNIVQRTLTSNRYSGEILMTYFNQGTDIKARKAQIQQSISKIYSAEGSDEFSIYYEDDLNAQFDESSFVFRLENLSQGYALEYSSDPPRILAACRADFDGKKYYAVTSCPLSDFIAQKNKLTFIYGLTVFGIALFAGAALYIFSRYFAKPIKRLSVLADDISSGDYQKRIDQTKSMRRSEEIQTLAESFNKMTEAVSSNIDKLHGEIQNRDTFVADFTHELKTPMTSIIGYSDMLRSYSLPPDETREIADTIYREGKRLQALSMRLLDIIVLKNQEIKLSAIRTDAFFEGFKKSVRFLCEKYGTEPVVEYQAAVITGESELLLSLMYNLFENACKASKKLQKVYVRGKIRGEKYLISVKDSGAGIKKENLDKITEPFFTEDKSRSRSLGGAGLGLALCRQIAELHNTELSFESTQGAGTTVSFSLLIKSNNTDTKEEQ